MNTQKTIKCIMKKYMLNIKKKIHTISTTDLAHAFPEAFPKVYFHVFFFTS